MSISVVVTIDGNPISVPEDVFLSSLDLDFDGGIDTATIQVVGGDPRPKPDPYAWKEVTVTIDGALVFKGDSGSAHPQHTELGYVYSYQCLGLRNRADFVPHTDSITGTDLSVYNLSYIDDPEAWLASRAGRTVGQIIEDVLTMDDNASRLDAWGIGAYTSLAPATLPSSTLADLATLDCIPPYPIHVSGDKVLNAVENVLRSIYPNLVMRVMPDGVIRFANSRQYSVLTLTLGGDDLIEPTEIARDWSNSFSRVIVRGQPITEAKVVRLADGSLLEDFAWGSYTTNSAAKAAWTPAKYSSPDENQDSGSCTCGSTTSCTVTSSSSTTTWPANFLDQTSTGRKAVIHLEYTSGTGLTQRISRRVTANTALSAGGTSTLTLDWPLPITSYDKYWIYCQGSPSGEVWRKYKVANTDDAQSLVASFPYNQPFALASNQITNVRAPAASIAWSSSGSPPYSEVVVGVTVDPSDGTLLFGKPTCLVWGSPSRIEPPDDIRAIIAVAVGRLTVTVPADISSVAQYEGTFYEEECGSSPTRAKTLYVTVASWRDPINQSQMEAYAQTILDSIKDTVCSGSVVYHDLYTPALEFGKAVAINGNGFTTGWESFNSDPTYYGLPIRSVSVQWSMQGGVTTTLNCSNHWGQFEPSLFLPPDRQWQPFGAEMGEEAQQTYMPYSQQYGQYGLHGVPVAPGDTPAPQLPGDVSGIANPNNLL